MIPSQAPSVRAKSPRLPLPAGATDCHFHVFESPDLYPVRDGHEYVPPLVTAQDTRKMFSAVGVSRAVIVQPSLYGRDNRCQLDALKQLGVEGRAVAVVPTDIDEAELAALHARGVRGIRFNLSNSGGLTLEDAARLADRVKELGWHFEFLLESSQVAMAAQELHKIPVPKVLAHFCLLDVSKGADQPVVSVLRDMLAEGDIWLKLSAPYRLAHVTQGYDEVADIVRIFSHAAPNRLLWGSDWPHAMYTGPMPHPADLLDALREWIDDGALVSKILVDNPASLYGFDKVAISNGRDTERARASATRAPEGKL